jgi:hypothetical protein
VELARLGREGIAVADVRERRLLLKIKTCAHPLKAKPRNLKIVVCESTT